MGCRGARQAGASVDQRRRRGARFHVHRHQAPLEPGGQRLQRARHRQGRRGHVHPTPPLGILGVRRGPLQAGRHHHPRVAAAHAKGRGLPRQQRRREGHRGGERRVRLHAGGRGHVRLPHGAREVHRGRLPRGLGRFRRAHRRLPRHLRAPHGRCGRHLQGHHADVLHEWHDGQPQGRGAQLRPSSRPHHHGEVLAAGAGEQAAHVGDRLRLGQVRLGQDLRPVDRRCHHLRLRHGQVRAHQASAEDSGLQAHHLLRAAHHVPLYAAGGRGRLRLVQRGELRHGG